MKFDVKEEAPCLSILAAMWLLALWAWPRSADRIAIHFNLDGHANGFGGKLEGLLLLPAIASVLYVASMFRGEQQRSPAGLVTWRSGQLFGPARVPRIFVLGFLLVLYIMMVTRAVGRDIAPDVVAMAIGVFIIALGNYLPKIQPNEFIGVRTPWTYRSELSWYRSHRLGGRLFMVCGAVTIVTAMLLPSAAIKTLLASLIVSGVVCVAYSYFVWRDDPARHDGQKPKSILK